jgi:uncharacterized protein (DUF433 family)
MFLSSSRTLAAFGSLQLRREEKFVSTTLTGVVANGVVVPSSPLLEGARVASQLSWISKKPNRCGGDACVRDTRITVRGLVAYKRLGLSDAEIIQAVPGLTAADLEAVWGYAAINELEIEQAIRANEEAKKARWNDAASRHASEARSLAGASG